MQYPSFTRIWVGIFFLLSSIKVSFFLTKDIGFFHRYLRWRLTFHWGFLLSYHQWVWPVVQIAVIVGNSNPSLFIFSIWQVAGWQRSIRMPPCPEDNDRNNVDEHRDDDDDDNDDHRRAVETNARESDGSDCYLALFANKMIRYLVAAMV